MQVIHIWYELMLIITIASFMQACTAETHHRYALVLCSGLYCAAVRCETCDKLYTTCLCFLVKYSKKYKKIDTKQNF